MIPSPSTCYAVSVLLSAAAFGPAAYLHATASNARSVAQSRLSHVQQHADLLTSSRQSLPSWALRTLTPGADRSQEAIASRASAAVAATGLPAATISSVSVQSDSEGAGTSGIRIERRRATLVLTQITLPQLGALLDTWRRTQPDWTPVTIDAAPETPRADKPPAPGADLPLHAVITLDSLALHPSPLPGARR